MKKLFIIMAAALSLALASCGTTKSTAYMTYETQCLGTERDGSQTLQAWGEGKNKADAEEQAKKNAVEDVIFKGIQAGKSDCTKVPLVNTPNARQKYEDFFNAFFADGGEYKNFVSMEDKKRRSGDKEHYQYGEKRSVTVRVLRPQLKKYLQENGILPK
ncbi:MAG: hypothetical protein NC102_08635 [Clostridium sp.]|nr:hypothetical protein [Clostridium sp.]